MRSAAREEDEEPVLRSAIEWPTHNSAIDVTRVATGGVCQSDRPGWVRNGEWVDCKVSLGHSLGHEPVGPVIDGDEDGDDVQDARSEYQTAGTPVESECTRDNGWY